MTTPVNNINELNGNTLSFTSLNTILRHYEALGNPVIVSKISTPPASIPDGEKYLIVAPATGNYVGRENQVVFSVGGAEYFLTPSEGMRLYDSNTKNGLFYDGTDWFNSPTHSVLSLTLTALTALEYAAYLIIDSPTFTHTLADLTFSAQTTIVNKGTTDFSVDASGTTYLVTAGASVVLVHSVANNWEMI